MPLELTDLGFILNAFYSCNMGKQKPRIARFYVFITSLGSVKLLCQAGLFTGGRIFMNDTSRRSFVQRFHRLAQCFDGWVAHIILDLCSQGRALGNIASVIFGGYLNAFFCRFNIRQRIHLLENIKLIE
jgi:hypothetical protein